MEERAMTVQTQKKGQWGLLIPEDSQNDTETTQMKEEKSMPNFRPEVNYQYLQTMV